MNLKGCFSHKTDNWTTPKEIMKFFKDNKFIDTFKYLDRDNEFEKEYHNQLLFCNPPYSKMKDVSNWIIKQFYNRNKIALLVPSRTDTEWFYNLYIHCYKDMQIFFIKGRLKFGNSNKSAPFPSMLIFLNSGESIHNEFTCCYWQEMLIYIEDYL